MLFSEETPETNFPPYAPWMDGEMNEREMAWIVLDIPKPRFYHRFAFNFLLWISIILVLVEDEGNPGQI